MLMAGTESLNFRKSDRSASSAGCGSRRAFPAIAHSRLMAIFVITGLMSGPSLALGMTEKEMRCVTLAIEIIEQTNVDSGEQSPREPSL